MSDLTVATEIINQMGGFGKLQAMVSANTFLGDDNSVQFKFKGSRKANICKVTLLPSDTYLFQLYKFSPKNLDCSKVYELEGAYNDMLKDLFESETGLYLSL